MTISPRDTPTLPRWKAQTLEMQTTRSSVGEVAEREVRLKRLILVGALASFLGFFGLTIAVDHQAAGRVEQTTQGIAAQSGSNQSVSRPQIRTRTS